MLKEVLLKQCVLFVNDKLAIIETIMAENRMALEQESKSSAGDKHETGRAMLHLEIEKASQQLKGIHEMKMVLSKIRIDDLSEAIKLGSVVITNHANYFLGISAGEIAIKGIIYFAISTASPIGKLLIGKSMGNAFDFNQHYVILEVF